MAQPQGYTEAARAIEQVLGSTDLIDLEYEYYIRWSCPTWNPVLVAKPWKFVHEGGKNIQEENASIPHGFDAIFSDLDLRAGRRMNNRGGIESY